MNKKIIVTCKGADELPIDVLEDFQGGLKKITKINLEKLKKRIIKNGINVPMFVWRVKKWYRILDGHQRLKALLSLRKEGWELPLIPIAYIEADNEKDARQKLLGITSQYGEFELEDLREWMSELDDDIVGTLRLADGELKIKKEIETENDDEVPEDIKPVSKIGDLWELGRHRVLCGDSGNKVDVERMMDGKKADMVFTDPPYGVSYADKNRYLNAISRGNHIQVPIENDHKEISELKEEIILPAFKNIFNILNNYSSYYITAPQGGDLLMMMMMMMQKSGLILRHMIIWNKNNHVLGRTDYNYKHEPILYGWVKRHKFYGNGSQKFSTWNYDKPLKSDLHPTMKPVEMIQNAILNSSESEMIILDLFLGSGSTLIACEKTDRICYGMELDEHYCDVIRDRYIKWCKDNNRPYTVKLNGKKYAV